LHDPQAAPRPGWYPDELVHAGEEHLDPDYVATYDRKAGFDVEPDLAVLRELGLGPESVVVDLGAGTGTFALAAAREYRRVVAVDVSPAMVAAMQARAAEAGLANVEVVHAGFLSYVHQGDPAQVVYSRNALHHLPDFWKGIALQHVADMLAPGGILRLHDLVYDFAPDEAGEALESWLAGAQPTPERGWTRAELEVHLRTEYSTYSWLMEPLLERAGFVIHEATYRPLRTYAAYTCVKR
jgi:SAM-dependent methyltransferase